VLRGACACGDAARLEECARHQPAADGRHKARIAGVQTQRRQRGAQQCAARCRRYGIAAAAMHRVIEEVDGAKQHAWLCDVRCQQARHLVDVAPRAGALQRCQRSVTHVKGRRV
jgi:hypothetical protein